MLLCILIQLFILTPGALVDHTGNVFAKDIEKDYKLCSFLSLHSKYLPLFCQANGSLWKEREGIFFLIWPHMPDWYLCLLILSVEWIGLRSTEEITKVHFWVSVRVIAETELPWYWTVPVISCGSDRITRRKEKLSAHSLPLCILEVWCELLSLPWQNETAETMRQRTLSPLNLFMPGFLSHRQENEHDI